MSHVPYASVVGSFMYAMVCSVIDISHAMRVLRRYMSKLGKEHWIAIERLFKYLHGTTDHVFFYQGRARLDRVLYVHGFFDAD